MSANSSIRGRHAFLVHLFVIAAIGAGPGPSRAEPQTILPAVAAAAAAQVRAERLEAGFWMCDYIVTTRGMIGAAAEECAAVTEAFKNERFGGSFEQMLEHWRANKPAEHGKIASMERH